MRRFTALGLLGTVLVARVASAQDAVTAGAVTTPYPTLENVSIEWAITGDDNGNATASVQYGEASGAATREGLPLVRVPAGSNEGFDWGNKLSGSIFGLQPGTTYAVALSLDDPDGGSATELVMVTTRAVPAIPAGAREIAVTPDSIDAALDASEPGDLVVLADGSYGEVTVPNDGTAELPIVLRAANSGGAVVDGDVRIDGRSYVFVEDLVVHGMIKFNDAESIVVRGCTIVTPDNGIVSYGSGVNNAVILRNTISGPTVWAEGSLGVDGDNLGEGVQLTGAGNVVAYNRVSGFRDCLSLLEDDEAVNQVSNDFYGNDLSVCADDAIEADFAMGNVRVYQNRIRDSFMGLSSQPSLGGPTYFVRNALYNVLFQAFKLQRSSVGDVGFHNTIVKSGDAFSVNTDDPISRAYFRNNLFIGGPGDTYNGYDSGPGEPTSLRSADATCSFDYDGYGTIGGTFTGTIGSFRYDSLSEMQSGSTEVHAVEVDLSVFAASVAYPADPFAAPVTPSLLLAEAGGAVDRGVLLPNVSDGFAGNAPDLGAFELGQSEPTYGPEGMSGSGGTGGTSGSGGTAGGGGTDASGGSTAEGGVGQGGNDATGGSAQGGSQGGTNAAGTAGTGGSGGSAGSAGSAGGSSGNTATGGSSAGAATGSSGSAGNDDEGGCGCRVPRRGAGSSSLGWILLGLSLVMASRRRRR